MARRGVSVNSASADALVLLGKQIKEARKARGWTMAMLASRLDIGLSTVSKIESGAPSISIGTVFNAAVVVGVKLFGLNPPELAEARQEGAGTGVLLSGAVPGPPARGGSGRALPGNGPATPLRSGAVRCPL
jgi:DNA-binding XRE family transcriptional regulator